MTFSLLSSTLCWNRHRAVHSDRALYTFSPWWPFRFTFIWHPFAGIDIEQARAREETLMLEDAMRWLASRSFDDRPHPITGAYALHVAAAKGYIKVMK